MNTPTSPTTIARKGTFADLLAGHVQRKCHGHVSLAYNAAWINRRTWSAIVTNPHRPVAKRTRRRCRAAGDLSCLFSGTC